MKRKNSKISRMVTKPLAVILTAAMMLCGAGIGEAAMSGEVEVQASTQDAVSLIADLIRTCGKSVDLSSTGIVKSEVEEAWQNAAFASRDYYNAYSKGLTYSFKSDKTTKLVSTFTLVTTETPEQLTTDKQALESKVNAIASSVNSTYNTRQKVQAVHDYLVKNVEYDYEAYLGNGMVESDYVAYGALVNGKANCSGYAGAFSLVLDKLAIENKLVISDELFHTWNKVNVDGTWYHVDVTYDDPVSDDSDKTGNISQKYFMLSDQQMITDKDHFEWNDSEGIDIPVTQKTPSIVYSTHIQDIGWQSAVKDGTLSGTTGKAKQLEAIKINITNSSVTGGITYSTHVQDIGWQSYVSNGAMAGTSGKAKQLEAIRIKLTGNLANSYDVYYRVHAADFGWLGWAKNGAEAGTAGYAKRLEAIEIKLVAKGGAAPGLTTNCYYNKADEPTVSYQTHVQDIGWQGFVSNGNVSGTTGLAKRLEGIKINLSNLKGVTGGISYQTHIQDIGWQSYVSNGTLSGTTGQAKRLEAIRIKLTGAVANEYDIYYRVHAEDIGWMGWSKNGSAAGTSGMGKRLEAIQIKIVRKGNAAPGSTYDSYRVR